jgi:hypothetical protein
VTHQNNAEDRVKSADGSKRHVTVKRQCNAEHNGDNGHLSVGGEDLLVIQHGDYHDDHWHQRSAHLVEVYGHPPQRSVSDGDVQREYDGEGEDRPEMRPVELLGLYSPKPSPNTNSPSRQCHCAKQQNSLP